MASNQHNAPIPKTGANNFLASHPEVLIGRTALHEARAKIGDPANTFIIYNKPVINIVLVQEFDANTKERLFAVALVDDEKAEHYYAQIHDGDNKCDECEEAGRPQQFLFGRATEHNLGGR